MKARKRWAAIQRHGRIIEDRMRGGRGREIQRQGKMIRGGKRGSGAWKEAFAGLFLGCTSSIMPGVPWKNLNALIDGFQHYRMYGRESAR